MTSVTYNVWGLDLSGTMQGAGGIGGLLAVIRNGEPFFPCYDANGNITEYLDTNGVIVAHYEYDPFGEIVNQSGALAATFTHRFSTKPWCEVTGLSEYEYRKYSPRLGRWLSRDPILDMGFLAVFAEKDQDTEAELSHIDPVPSFLIQSQYEERLMDTGNGNPMVFVLNNSLNGWDVKGLDITLETGNSGASYLNNKYHQAICVDKWSSNSGRANCTEENKWRCCHLGKTCFSFGKIIGVGGTQLPQFSSMWLGWSSIVSGAILKGEIYGTSPVVGAIIERRHITTMKQDFNFERYLHRRTGTPDGYSVGRHNCRKYSQWEFRDAPFHW
jgi:RHS repeat-associated protein